MVIDQNTSTNLYFLMEFKIDTKSTYTNIAPPTGPLDAIMTDAIRQKWYELIDDGCQNLILDLHNITNATQEGIEDLLELHEDNYSNNRSLAITGLTGAAAQDLKNAGELNITPTLIEAVDIINMEVLERELFSEE